LKQYNIKYEFERAIFSMGGTSRGSVTRMFTLSDNFVVHNDKKI